MTTRLLGLLFAFLLLAAPAADARLSVTNLSGFGGGGSSVGTPPDEITGANLVVWYRADQGITGDPVSQWNDLSGNGRNLTQATSGSRPDYVASGSPFSGQPYISCDGTDDRIGTAAAFTSETQPYHVFMVAHIVTYGADDYLAHINDDAGGGIARILMTTSSAQIYQGAATATNAVDPETGNDFLLNSFFSGASSYQKLNNDSAVSGGNPGTAAMDKITLCSIDSGANYAAIYIAEFFAFDAEVTGDELTNLESYINARYSLW